MPSEKSERAAIILQAIVHSEEDHFPGPHAFILSLVSWYIDLATTLRAGGHLDEERFNYVLMLCQKATIAVDVAADPADFDKACPLIASDVAGSITAQLDSAESAAPRDKKEIN